MGKAWRCDGGEEVEGEEEEGRGEEGKKRIGD